MEIKTIKLKELEAFVVSDAFIKCNAIAITDLRVKSLLNNPNARPDDVVLIVAFEDHQLLGYIGALPTNINNVHGAWNSCWWVSKTAPGGLSMQLMYQFVAAWDKKVLFSEMTPYTSKIVQAMGFCRHETIWGMRGFYRFHLSHYLLRKYKKLKWLSPLIKAADSVLNFGLNVFRGNGQSSMVNVSVDKLPYPDEEGIKFIHTHPGTRDRNNSAVFRWINAFPWLTTEDSDAVKDVDARYYFSYHTKHFDSYWLKFTMDGKVLGLVMFSIRDFELKLPYVFFNATHLNVLALEIKRTLQKDKTLASVTTYDPGLGKYLQKHVHGFIHKRPVPKYTAVSNEVLKALNNDYPHFQMGDGDVVFT